MVGLLHAMAFMVLLLIGWVIWNNKPLPLPLPLCWSVGCNDEWSRVMGHAWRHATNCKLCSCLWVWRAERTVIANVGYCSFCDHTSTAV